MHPVCCSLSTKRGTVIMKCCGRERGIRRLLPALIAVLFCSGSVRAESVKLMADPGAVGTSFSHQTFRFVGALDGTVLNGQTRSVAVLFREKKFAAAGAFRIGLAINQSGDLGTSPARYFSVKGQLLDAAGRPLGEPVAFSPVMTMPAQIWPGWGYYLADGKEYIPATTGYEADFSGSPLNADKWNNYFIDPILFSGVHFEITYPDTPRYTVKGLGVTFSASNSQIYVSPDPLPKFKGHKKREVVKGKADGKNRSGK
jgi:hypothetical protein